MAPLVTGERFLLSAPLRLYWAGWETTTHKLQQAGWSLAVEQNVMEDKMRIVMDHQTMHMQAMTDHFDFQFRRSHAERSYDVFSPYRENLDYLQHLIIPCQAMARSINIQTYNTDWSNFQAVDAMPMMATKTISRLEDLVHFAPSQARTNQIILPEEDVPALMERILKLQDPARQARLRAELREDRDGIRLAPHHKFHAQIISLAA